MKVFDRYDLTRCCGIAMSALLALVPVSAAAQQRATVNESFESNDPQGPGTPSYEFINDALVPGWTSTSGQIELWDSTFNSVPAHDGAVFAEMNASAPGSLYQDICLLNGETIGWSFAHRARTGGPSTQNARFELANSSGTVLQVLANQASTTSNLVWTVNSGAATYTGASGVQRLQFTTTDPGSFGNFLDAISINLRPFVQLSIASESAVESTISSGLPTLMVSGTVATAFTVNVRITGGTATRGDDYTTPNGNANFTVTIPAGAYDNTPIDTGIQITDDSDLESTETITMRLRPGSDYTRGSTTICGGSGLNNATYSILDDDSRVTLRKQWVNAAIGDSTEFSITRGSTVIDSLNSLTTAASQLDSDPTPTEVVIGETLALAEALGNGNTKSYISGLTCTGAADSDLTDGLTIGAGETAITCTYTNTGIDTLLVSKTSAIVSDGFSAAADGKAIPGATVRYCITVTNPGVMPADNVTAADPLPSEIDFVAGTIRSGTSCTTATTLEDEDNIGTDETDAVGVQLSGTSILASAASLAASTSFAILFDAVVK